MKSAADSLPGYPQSLRGHNSFIVQSCLTKSSQISWSWVCLARKVVTRLFLLGSASWPFLLTFPFSSFLILLDFDQIVGRISVNQLVIRIDPGKSRFLIHDHLKSSGFLRDPLFVQIQPLQMLLRPAEHSNINQVMNRHRTLVARTVCFLLLGADLQRDLELFLRRLDIGGR